MSESRKEDSLGLFPESCRVCLKLDKQVRCLLIKSIHNEDLMNKLRTLMQCELRLDLHSPNNLCTACENDLVIAYNFVKTCHLTNLKIRTYNKSKMFERQSEAEEIKMEIDTDETIFGSNSRFEIADTEITEFKSDDTEEQQDEGDCIFDNDAADDDDLDDSETQTLEKDFKELIDVSISDTTRTLNDVDNKKDDESEICHQLNDSDNVGKSVVTEDNQEFQHRSHVTRIRIKTVRKVSKQKEKFRKKIRKSNLETNARKQQDELSQGITQTGEDNNKKPKILCTKCNKHTTDLQKHNAIRHDSATARIYDQCIKGDNPTCTVCSKKFKSNNSLRDHIRLKHTDELPHICRFCNLRTQTAPALKRHERTHTGEKTFICHFCGKGFPAKTNLLTHLPQHTGKKYICHICGKACIRSSHLKIHMTRHTGEFRFTCTYCDKKFYMNAPYQEHLRSHTNERPFSCHICEKTFKSNNNLKKHVKKHTAQKPFRCMYCTYACWEPFRLRQHTKTHDKELNSADRNDDTSQEMSIQ